MRPPRTDPPVRPAVVYAAKSTGDPHGSIDTQLAEGNDLARREGWQVVAQYSDEAASAYSGNRGPSLTRALAECESLCAIHGSCALIVQHSDRLARGDGREARHLIEIVIWAIKRDIQLLSVQAPEILAGGDLALVLGAIGGMRNHQDSKRKSLAVQAGMLRRAERGKLAGGPRPYGYWWIGPKGEKSLEVVPAEAVVVLRIFRDYVNGVSQRALARDLTEEGIPTATGKTWQQSTIARLLANPIYKGAIRHGSDEFPGLHEPIIDEALWEQAAAIRGTAVRRPRGRWPKGAHLLTKGLLRCGSCGSSMIPTTKPTRTDGVLYEVYECSARKRSVEWCAQPPVPRQHIDEPLVADLTEHYIDLDATRQRIAERTAADLALANEALAHADSEAALTRDRLARIQRGFQDGILDGEDYRDQRARLLEEDAAAQAALTRAQEQVQRAEAAGRFAGAEEPLLRHLGDLRTAVERGIENAPDLNALRTVLRDLFESIELIRWPGFGVGGGDGLHPFHDGNPVVESGGQSYALLPRVRWNAVNDDLTIRKVPLPPGIAGAIEAEGLPT